MQKLSRQDLMTLEQYSVERSRVRAEVIAHKQLRNVQVGPNMTWCFEDRTTIRYQVLEMLRAERIFEPAGIQDELDAYNPLIPSGCSQSPTRISSARTRRRPPRCTSCASSCRPRWSGRLRAAPR